MITFAKAYGALASSAPDWGHLLSLYIMNKVQPGHPGSRCLVGRAHAVEKARAFREKGLCDTPGGSSVRWTPRNCANQRLRKGLPYRRSGSSDGTTGVDLGRTWRKHTSLHLLGKEPLGATGNAPRTPPCLPTGPVVSSIW